nr:MAG TPA: hypothetical protein [Caudoviricetes sp.]
MFFSIFIILGFSRNFNLLSLLFTSIPAYPCAIVTRIAFFAGFR